MRRKRRNSAQNWLRWKTRTRRLLANKDARFYRTSFCESEIRKNWLGGLDSNQDSQIQSLESYQLDDLPADENAGLTSYRDRFLWGKQGHLSEFYAKL